MLGYARLQLGVGVVDDWEIESQAKKRRRADVVISKAKEIGQMENTTVDTSYDAKNNTWSSPYSVTTKVELDKCTAIFLRKSARSPTPDSPASGLPTAAGP